MPTRQRPAPPRRVALVTGAGSADGIGFAAASLLGPGLGTVVAILAVTGWMGVARVVRA